MRLLERERVEQPREVLGPIGDREGLERIVRCPGAGRIPRHDLVPIREIAELRLPRARIAQEPVKEYDGRSLALFTVEDGAVAHVDVMHRWLAQRSPSMSPAATSGGSVSCNRAACCSAFSRIPSSSRLRVNASPIAAGDA